MNTNPIFIVGMPRSGTTLVEQILSCHSKIYAAGETEILDKLKIDNTTNPVRTKSEKILIFDNRKSIKSNMNE